MTKHKKKGVTLIELLITTSLIAMMGLAIYSTFASGLEVWQRGQRSDMAERATKLDLEKIAKELRNSFRAKGITFRGTELEVSFPFYVAMIDENEEKGLSVGQVSYLFDESGEKLMRREWAYSDLSNTFQPPKARTINTYVTGVKFSYYYFNEEEKKYEWKEEWEESEEFPIGVKIEAKVKKGKEENEYVKIVYFPVSESS